MTIRDVLAAVGRRWYVLLAALIAMGLLGAFLINSGGTFATRTIVVFTLPKMSTLQPYSGSTDSSVIAFASTVATEINGGRAVLSYSSADAPYYGAGVREGVIVALRNEGGQWTTSFPSATIEIQIVGRTEGWVRDTQQRILHRIAETTQGQQDATVTAADERISAHIEPLTTGIEHIVASRSSTIAALAALFAVAVLVGAWGCVTLDRAVRRGARSRGPRRSRRLPVPAEELA